LKNFTKTTHKIAINFIKIFNEGPLVSFNGSPTVSPITDALCSSVPFILLDSKNFLALSHAPPLLAALIANYTLLTIIPGSNPIKLFSPNKNPKRNGIPSTKNPGPFISLKLALVLISIQVL